MRNSTKFIAAGLALIGALSFSTLSIAAPSYAAKISADKPAIPSTSGFSGVPGKAAGGPDVQRSRFTYQTEPGQSIHDYFYVSNVGSEPIDLRVYAADGSTAQNGSFDVGVATDQPKDVGSWVRFQNGQPQLDVHLKVGQSKTLPFDLTIPANAAPGDHVGGMAVSTVASTDGQIKIERRVVTRLYARLTGVITPSLSVSNMSAHYVSAFNPLDGIVYEHFTLTNTGNVSLKAVVTTQVLGVAGIPLAADVVTNVAEVLPGFSRDVEIQVPGVGQWVYLNPRIHLVPDVDSDALNPGALKTADKDVVFLEFPTTWFIIIVICLAFFFTIRARHRAKQRQMKKWMLFTEQEARRKAGSDQ